MPKLKTKSGAKKRFKVIAAGKVMAAHADGGARLLFKVDGDNIEKYFLPNA